MSAVTNSQATENKSPKVSVCIASYNHAKYLGETLNSILAQTFQDFEVVIVDDGSKDNSLEILQKYAGEFPKIKLLTHAGGKNKGISATANLAIENARGEYIAFIGSDDVWYDYALQKQVEIFERDSSIGLVYGLTDLIDENSNKIEGQIGKDITRSDSPVEEMIKANRFPASTIAVRKSCLDKLGLFDETLVYSDWELNLRIVSEYKVAFVDSPLSKYRIHTSNTSIGISTDKQIKYSNEVFARLLEKSRRNEVDISPKALKKGFGYISKKIYAENIDNFIISANKGDFAQSAFHLKKALNVYPQGVFNTKKSLIIIKYLLVGIYRAALGR